jgi:hypothetical protein
VETFGALPVHIPAHGIRGGPVSGALQSLETVEIGVYSNPGGGRTAAATRLRPIRSRLGGAGFQPPGILRAETLLKGRKNKPVKESRMQDIELLLNFFEAK